jgi:hypothetical protein
MQMSFLDKVKAGVKSGAEQAATRAQAELERRQAKRELQQAYAVLGERAFELADRGEFTHAELQPSIDRVREARNQLDGIGSPSEPAAEGQDKPASTDSPESG